jgi:hypothetical protein
MKFRGRARRSDEELRAHRKSGARYAHLVTLDGDHGITLPAGARRRSPPRRAASIRASGKSTVEAGGSAAQPAKILARAFVRAPASVSGKPTSTICP